MTLKTVKRRPWLAPVAAAGLAALLLFVPVSYQTTTGYDVRLEINGSSGTAPQAGHLVADFAKTMSIEHAAVSLSGDGGRTVILARVSEDDRSEVERRAAAFAAQLSGEGLSSRVSVSPVMEMTTSPVYAMGLGRGLRLDIQRKGRHSSDVERDIEAQLRQADIVDADVSYTDKDGCSLIQIVMPGGTSAAGSTSDGLHVALICAASDADCKRKCADRPDCATTCSTSATTSAGPIQVSLDGQTGYVCSGEVTLESVAGLSDAQIADAIRTKFASQGCQTDVVVRNGAVVSVEPKCDKN